VRKRAHEAADQRALRLRSGQGLPAIDEQAALFDALADLQRRFAPDELERLFAEGTALSDDEAARRAVG
jgi:hypothetical protein